jgi:spore protease
MSVEKQENGTLNLGSYVTISFDKFTPDDVRGEVHSAIKTELLSLIKNAENVLVVGLGNRNITPDAIGPKVVEGIFSTRHIEKAVAESVGLKGLRTVSAIATGVLGQTGIEAAEQVLGTVQRIKPSAVIVVDALAARDISRLGCTVQLTDSGIRPGSGVGNSRAEISEKTLGVPTVAIGVPTVVDAATFAEDIVKREYLDPKGCSLMVTSRDIDSMINYSAKAIAHAINCALQPEIESEILLAL